MDQTKLSFIVIMSFGLGLLLAAATALTTDVDPPTIYVICCIMFAAVLVGLWYQHASRPRAPVVAKPPATQWETTLHRRPPTQRSHDDS